MADLPEGPVTIMFTDVEGSTALRTSLGDEKTDALFREHDEIIRAEIVANRGTDQKAALGDGFLAVFVSTRRAVACGIAIQKAFDTFNRSRSGPSLNVRLGLNTGEVAWQDGQLSGEAVHAAARVCSAGSGGQILVSDVTRQLAGTVPDVTFRDAGEFQLKGFPQPWRLWNVVWVRETTAMPEQVFVGRDAELTHLRSRLMGALDGRGGLVLLGGEPGVGKTTLVRQLIREAEKRGALAVFGRCYESDGTIPYSPFVEMLEQALALMPADIVREDMGDDAPEVARMVPELRRRFPDIGQPLDLPPEQQRRYFMNAVTSFVARGASRFPLLMVMDDLHWADEPTLLLIEHMAAVMPELRILGVGTYRDVELDVSRPLAATLERLLRGRIVERLQIKRFDRTTVATMIEALADQPPPDAVVDAIFGETEGNPFFVEEVFRHLVEEGKLFDGEGFRSDIHADDLDVPESVRLVVGRRLERLGPDARKVLAAGAVVGRAFPFRLLEEIVDLDSATLLDVVEAAEQARVVVVEERDGEVHYSFGHELIRQTLLSGLSVLRRQRLHLAVADAIERIDKRARLHRPSEIAQHLLLAGAAADAERTLELLELTAQRALDAAAFEEALRAIDDATAIVEADDELRVAKLRVQRGWAVRALGHFDECITLWSAAIDTFAMFGLTDEAAALSAETGYQQIWLNRFDEGFVTYARGMTIIGEQPTPTRARLLGLSGGMAGLAGFYEAGVEQLDEAESIARALGDDRALGQVLWARTMAEWSNSRSSQAIESGREAIECLRRANDQWSLADALAWTSYPLILSCRSELLREGETLAAEAVELGRRIGHRGGETLGLRGVYIAQALIAGDVATLEQCGRDDLAAFATIESPWRSQSHVFIASAMMMKGDFDGALWHAAEAIELEPASAWSGAGWSYAFLAHAWGGNADECRKLLDESRHLLPGPGESGPIGRLFMLLSTVAGCVIVGLRDEAAALYPSVANCGDLALTGFDYVVPERMAGMAAAAAERWDDAERHFASALRQVEHVGNNFEQPQIEHWYGQMLLDRSQSTDRERARQLLTAAVEHYKTTGMPVHEARAADTLRRC